MMDHIFSYEFKTLELDNKKAKTGEKSQKKKEGGGEKPASTAAGQSTTPEGQNDKAMLLKPIYRESPNYPPKDLESCKTWWDVVVYRFNGELASVSFVIERQEETLRHEPEIQRAWLQLALNDYRTEFLRVYDHLTFFDREMLQIKELYNQESYLFANSTSLLNIKEKYLNNFDMVTPNSPLLRRYAKYLFDNFQERFQQNQDFLLMLQQKHQFLADDISDFDYEEFNAQKEEAAKAESKPAKATEEKKTVVQAMLAAVPQVSKDVP